MPVQLGHGRLVCLPFLRLVRQLALLDGQCLRLRFKARLRVLPLLPLLRRQRFRPGLDVFPTLGLF